MSDDTEYFYRRAEAELERAQQAISPAAVKAHYTLAGFYLDRVYSGLEPMARTGGSVGDPTLSH